MNMTFYWPLVLIILQLVFLEGILSIDNAAIIGALVTPLSNGDAYDVKIVDYH